MRRTTFAAAAVAIALAGAACNTQGGGGGEGDLAGSIQIDGSSTVYPISNAVAESFQDENGGVQIAVGQSGTGGGFEKFCAGEIDVADASRPIEDDEEAACTDGGVEYPELSVATDGLSVVVNAENDFVECLTVDELKKIWEPGSTVENWSDIRDDFPDDEIKLYGPGADSGTFDYFTDVIVGEEGKSRSDYTASENDNQLVRGVAGDESALGYFGYAYYIENTDKLKAVGIVGGDGCFEPTEETIGSGEYKPLARPLFIYPSNESLADEHVASFVRYYLDNVSEIAPEVGYVALPDEDLAASKAALNEVVGE